MSQVALITRSLWIKRRLRAICQRHSNLLNILVVGAGIARATGRLARVRS